MLPVVSFKLLESCEFNLAEAVTEKFIDKKSLIKVGKTYREIIDVKFRLVSEFIQFATKLPRLDIAHFKLFRFRELKDVEKLRDVTLLNSKTSDLEAHETTPVFTLDKSI